MVNQESGVSGGWGASVSRGGGGSGEQVTYGSGDGTYTDPKTGKPITKEQAMAAGIIDKPGEATAKFIAIGGGQREQTTIQAPIGLEALKSAELQAAKEDTARRQSQQTTTPGEALAIQRMLRSPTAQFASQEAAQRGYELASGYDRSFAPEHVRATLAPQYAPQSQEPQRTPSRFFGPAPREQAGIRPGFPTPAQPGSIAERAEFQSRTKGFYTYGTVRRLEGISSRLQSGVERTVGYDEKSSFPVKATVGFASAFTGLPAFAGQVAGAGEAIIRYPSASLRGLPTGFKILSSKISEQATTKPVEFVGSLVGMVVIGRYAPKVSVPKVTSEGFKTFARSETATLYPQRTVIFAERPTVPESLRNLRVAPEQKTPSYLERTSTQGNLYGTFESKYQASLAKSQPKIENPPEFRYGTPEFNKYVESIKKHPLIESQETVLARWAEQKLLPAPQQTPTRRLLTSPTSAREISRTQLAYAPQKILKDELRPNIVLSGVKQLSRAKPERVNIVLPTILNLQKTSLSQKTKSITTPSNILKQKSEAAQRISLKPVQKVRTIQNIDTLTVAKPIIRTKIIQEAKTATKTTDIAIKRPTELLNRRPTKITELPRQRRSSVSTRIKKSSSLLISGRKYTTKLGGKTVKQLEADLIKRRK